MVIFRLVTATRPVATDGHGSRSRPIKKGPQRSIPLWALNVHLVNHGTQHRSEVAMMLTDLGHSPGDLDMVFFLAERFPYGSE